MLGSSRYREQSLSLGRRTQGRLSVAVIRTRLTEFPSFRVSATPMSAIPVTVGFADQSSPAIRFEVSTCSDFTALDHL